MQQLPIIRISKRFSFECAHALSGYNGPCKNIHGHSYELEIVVSGQPQFGNETVPEGMVMDFTEIKAIVKYRILSLLDHKLVIHERDAPKYEQLKETHSIVTLPYNPTCEMLVIFIQGKLFEYLPAHVRLETVRLRETSTAWAEWHSCENR